MKRSLMILSLLVPVLSSLASGNVAAQAVHLVQADATVAIEKLLRAGQLDEAMTAANKATTEDPGNARAHFLMGRIHFQRENDVAARAAFDRALAINPTFAEAVFFRGLSAKYSNKHELALADFMKAVELDPREGKYWLEVAHMRRKADQKGAAIDAYEQAVKLDPRQDSAWFYLGTLAAEKGEHAKAAQMWEKALELEPTMDQAHFNLGLHHQLRGDAKISLSHFQFFLVQNPNNVEALKKVMQAAHRLGKLDLAEQHRKKLVDLIAKSRDPNISGLKEFCFDQFDVPGGRIFAYETVLKQGDLYYWYTFKVVDDAGKLVRTINLESSKGLTELNVAFVLGRNEGVVHTTFNFAFKELPAYPALKALVVQANNGELQSSASSRK